MFELSPETIVPIGHPESKPDSSMATRVKAASDETVVMRMTPAELDALTDIVLNAPPTKLVDEEMAEHLLRKLIQLQREMLFTSPE
jgi:hypothetical protein